MAVEARPGHRIWLRYSDGVDGEVDLSHLAGRGVFEGWDDRAFFESVRLDGHGGVVWGRELDVCGEALYIRLTGTEPGGGAKLANTNSGEDMPEICRFYGIVIQMYHSDHGPPHFHARYGGARASFDIETLGLLRGRMPPRARLLVIEWASRHQEDLRSAWERVGRHEPPGRIAPLE